MLPAVATGAPRPRHAQQDRPPRHGSRPRPWLAIGLGTVVVFVLAVLVVTAIEAVRDEPLSGGDRGTTIGRILGDAEPSERPEPAPGIPEP